MKNKRYEAIPKVWEKKFFSKMWSLVQYKDVKPVLVSTYPGSVRIHAIHAIPINVERRLEKFSCRLLV